MNEVTVEDLETLREMHNHLINGQAVLTGGEISPDIPTIHDVGHRNGQALQTAEEVEHMGFGFFRAGNWTFSGGGAMNRSKNFSWTLLLPRQPEDVATIGYNIPLALSAVETLIDRLEE